MPPDDLTGTEFEREADGITPALFRPCRCSVCTMARRIAYILSEWPSYTERKPLPVPDAAAEEMIDDAFGQESGGIDEP